MWNLIKDKIFSIGNLRRTSVLIGHRAELSNCLYNYDCSLIASSSMDKSAKVWDARMNSCVATLLGHDDEVLDLAFDNNGKRLSTASSDTTARVWDISSNFQQLALMKGHQEEVSKGKFFYRKRMHLFCRSMCYINVLKSYDSNFQFASVLMAINF